MLSSLFINLNMEDNMELGEIRIEKPICPYCKGTDMRIMRSESPGYWRISVIFVCKDCKQYSRVFLTMEES